MVFGAVHLNQQISFLQAYVEFACIFVCRGVHAACYFVRMCNSHSEILQYSLETLRKIGVNWSKPPKRVVCVFVPCR